MVGGNDFSITNSDNDLERLPKTHSELIVGIGSPSLRKSVVVI